MSQPDRQLVGDISEAYRRWRLPLQPDQAESFATYLELLERWNEAVNLTAIRDRPTAILRHFVEPAMAVHLLAGAGPVLLDVGTGAGFPGLPLKILEPERTCILVEANGRKASFLREVIDVLGVEDTTVLEGRLEEHVAAGALEGPIHLLTARAWTAWGHLLGITARLMAPGGRAVLFVGDETLRALRRHLSAEAAGPVKGSGADDWGPAASAGWRIRRVVPLPHLDRAAIVSIELPAE